MRHPPGPTVPSNLLARLRRGWRARDGLAALEFALLAPLLVSTVGGLYDLTTGFIAWNRVAMAAQSIDEIATSMAATSAGTNVLDVTKAASASSAVYAYLPNILSASPNAFGITVSSIAMVPNPSTCTVGCTYTPHVAWSGVFQGSGTRRPCDARAGVAAMSFVSDGSTPSPTTLPVDLQSAAAPLLIVDVVYTFKPVFFTYLTGNIPMTQSAYFSPRTGVAGDWVQYFSAGPSDSTSLCPGYPAAAADPT